MDIEKKKKLRLGIEDRNSLDNVEAECIWEPPTFDTSGQPSLAHEANLLLDPISRKTSHVLQNGAFGSNITFSRHFFH